MCGICGIVAFDHTPAPETLGRAVLEMRELLARRGPDDQGLWAAPDGRLQLGFRRLAVLDPTPAGHQPMVSADGRSAIVFNGEIYNFRELGHELERRGAHFRSRTDTEVLLEALNHWGIDALHRLNGMFAFAWYHLPERTLWLARDHAGIKPLYYLRPSDGSGLAFASQFNALLRTPWGMPGAVRPDALHLYLRLHHLPPPYGLLENTHQVEAGQYLRISPDGRLDSRRWWELPRDPKPDLQGEAAGEALSAAIDAAVRRQRVADVPLGVFLSGGVDSPLVTAVARSQTGPGLKAFTVGSPGWRQDESADAAAYARHLDVDHRVVLVSGEDLLNVLSHLQTAQHEPFADFSLLPTLLVSRLAREHVTVALSGDGGDEAFFGYARPLSLLRHGSDFRWPWPVRLALFAAGRYGLGPRRSDVVLHRSPGEYYFNVNCRVSEGDLRVLAPDLPPLPADFDLYASGPYRGASHLAHYSRRVEFYGQLQRGLKKVDMASMHHGLEVRVPLLDREVVDLSLRIDPFDCMKNGVRKAPLRDLLAGHVPAAAISTSKRGFSVPLDAWLRGPLRPLVEDTLLGGELFPSGVFDPRGVRQYWEEHLCGRRDHKWGLWTLLGLQWWARTHLPTRALTYA